MCNIDREDKSINGRHYWALYDCRNSEDNSVNQNYIWVIKKDLETAYTFKENIYCVNENKFLFEIWFDSVGRGIVHDGSYFCVYYERSSDGIKHRQINTADINDGHLLGEWKLYYNAE